MLKFFLGAFGVCKQSGSKPFLKRVGAGLSDVVSVCSHMLV